VDKNLYNKARRNNCSPRMAELLACRQPPGVVADSIRGVAGGDPFVNISPEHRSEYARRMRAAGVAPAGKRYMPTLARFPADPRAMVDSRSDVKRLADEITAKPIAAEPVAAEPADDIVEERAQQMLYVDGCDGTCTVKEWEDTKEKARKSVKGED